MSERRQQSWFVPLRVRFRSPAEQAQWERDHILQSTLGDSQTLPPPIADVATGLDIEAQRHTRQIKELLRLSNIMRADLGLSEVLQQIVASRVRSGNRDCQPRCLTNMAAQMIDGARTFSRRE